MEKVDEEIERIVKKVADNLRIELHRLSTESIKQFRDALNESDIYKPEEIRHG